jgi:AcrR family transcriptional regulator
VAEAAHVSRAMVYRYVPRQSRLIATITDYSLGPVRSCTSSSKDGVVRLHELFDKTHPRFKEFEPQMRAALQLALTRDALDRAGMLKEEPYRREFRRAILENAARPPEKVLGKARFHPLVVALSMVYGIEPYVVLKDIRGLQSRDVEVISRWMADALIAAALADVGKGDLGSFTRGRYRPKADVVSMGAPSPYSRDAATRSNSAARSAQTLAKCCGRPP